VTLGCRIVEGIWSSRETVLELGEQRSQGAHDRVEV
jgi:hypothetical protein